MIYRPAQLRYRTRKRESREDRWSKRSHSKSISCARTSSNTGIRPSPRCRPPSGSGSLSLNTDFGELRLASMDKAGIERAVLALAGPGVQAERDTATAIRNAKSGNDFLAKEIQKRPDRYSGFAHLPMQDAKAAADELERCVKRSEVLRRHDQRPHQRAISRPSVALAVLGARRGARHADLHPSDRSGVGRAGAARPSGTAPRHLGMDLRDRLARAAAGVRRRVRPLPEGAARPRPHGRDACRSCCGASTAAPARTSTTSA